MVNIQCQEDEVEWSPQKKTCPDSTKCYWHFAKEYQPHSQKLQRNGSAPSTSGLDDFSPWFCCNQLLKALRIYDLFKHMFFPPNSCSSDCPTTKIYRMIKNPCAKDLGIESRRSRWSAAQSGALYVGHAALCFGHGPGAGLRSQCGRRSHDRRATNAFGALRGGLKHPNMWGWLAYPSI